MEPVGEYISWFRMAKYRCRFVLLEIEFIKLATGGLNFELQTLKKV